VGLSGPPLRSFLFYRLALLFQQVTKPESVLTDWSHLWERLASALRLLRKNISEMVRIRATAPGANNPHHKVGGASHQNTAEMKARIAQMSRDMEVLTQQNLSLQRRLVDE
jgi:hypothetical protein